MTDSWELYKRDPGRRYDHPDPIVSITKDGAFNLNRRAWEELGRPDRVHLLYDRAATLVGLRATTNDDGFKVNKPPNPTGSYKVSGQGFMRYYGIDHSTSRLRLPAHFQDGTLILDLGGQP